MRVLLLAFLLFLPCGVMAQHPEAVKSETVTPDAGPEGTDQQVQENTVRLDAQEKMTGNQDFILKLLGILAPIVILFLQYRQSVAMKAMQASVNGMKHELVDEVRKGALLQGAATERAKPKSKADKNT